MIFFAILVMLPVIWFLPWWAVALSAFVLGYWVASRVSQQLSVAVAAGLVWAALAYLRDGQNYGLISKRMSGLLGLPYDFLIFPALAILGFAVALLWVRMGALVRSAQKP